MASPTGFLSVNELDFNAYRESLRTFLSQQDQFKDYDFAGSNLSVLLDLLAYNTYMNGTYLNLIGSEMFLDTAQQRESIVSHAKELNYTPRSRASSMAIVDIVLEGNNLPSVVTIPKNYKVSGKATDGQSFMFVTNQPINIGSANNYTANSVVLYEGRIVNETYVANSSARYILQSANVDVSSIEVVIQESSSNTSNSEWVHSTTLFGISDSTKAFFVQGYQDYMYEVVFGNGIVGKSLAPGNIVRISYRDTSGLGANGIKRFVAAQSIEGYQDVAVSLSEANTAYVGGAYHESNADIKFNSPRYFATQERAVTATDYVTLLQNKFPTLEAVTAYGGEEAEPKQFGRVIISAKPSGSTILSNAFKDQIIKFLKNKTSLSIDPVIVDPDFYSCSVSTNITYNLNATTKSPTELAASVRAGILSFNDDNLSMFGSDLRYSKLLRAIDDSDSSIVSNDTHVLMTKKLYPVLLRSQSYSFSFGNTLDASSVDDPALISNSFSYLSGETIFNAFLSDDGAGIVRVYTFDSLNNKISLASVGAISYATGAVSISALSIVDTSNADDSLQISARLANADIETNNNKILLIEADDITITTNGIRI